MGFANRFQLVLFGARQRLGLLEGLFAGELFRPKAPVRIVLEIEVLARLSVRKTKLPHSGTASCLISRIGIPHDSADRAGSEAATAWGRGRAHIIRVASKRQKSNVVPLKA